jgi:hypothetical protein
VIDRKPSPLRLSRPAVRGWSGDATEAADEPESLLEPGALRRGFSLARSEKRRPRRWLADLVGPPPPAPGAEDVQRQLAELEVLAERLHVRERDLVRREEAAARWFSELNRIQRQLDEERRRELRVGAERAVR